MHIFPDLYPFNKHICKIWISPDWNLLVDIYHVAALCIFLGIKTVNISELYILAIFGVK